MPIRQNDDYPGAPWHQWNGHLQTILPSVGGPKITYQRERLELVDGDFLDLDWLRQAKGSQRLIVLTHGLEGNTTRPYVKSAAQYFHRRGWDILAWNCRSCSGEMNRTLRLYHHGEIEDIQTVIEHGLASSEYAEVVLIGYSMGGAMTSKYLGVHGSTVPKQILGGIAFSAPYDLAASVDLLEKPGNRIYKKRFLRQLSAKMHHKARAFPGVIDISKLRDVRRWRDFDTFFTAPLLGLERAEDFYALASAKNFLGDLARPILTVCAQNDPIIDRACLPLALAQEHPLLTLELTRTGGHVGYGLRRKSHNWMDVRAEQEIARWRNA
ncbi:MAG: alpha/beta fold hydrolase [Bacteroidota bacterium]